MRILIIALSCALSVTVWADNHENETYVYATYFNCDPMGEDAADATFDKYFKPAYNASLKSGDITAWGYMKHHTGGNWRRLSYHMGPSVIAVLNAGDKQGEMIDKKMRPRDDNFSKACRSHDDYIWKQEAGNTAGERGKAGISMYFVCDMTEEVRADELVLKDFARVYDTHVGPGKLTSWGWLSHVFGGKYRRLLTMTAANTADLLKTRTELLDGLGWSAAGREFTSICGTHSDYLWDIASEGR